MSLGVPFGRFRLIKRLGGGGFSEVFLARDTAHPDARLQAIKRIHPTLSDDAEAVRVLLREAQLVAQLAHPFLVELYGMGREDGQVYLALEYVHGATLSEATAQLRQSGRSWPWPHAVRIASWVCEVLHYLHRLQDREGRPLGLMHGDLHPGNVMLAQTGCPKLLDLGLARTRQRWSHRSSAVVALPPEDFRPPERTTESPGDLRSDVYGVGATLLYLLTGASPRAQGPSTVTDVPRALRRALEQSLSSDPGARPANALVLRNLLEDVLDRSDERVGMLELRDLMDALFPGRARLHLDPFVGDEDSTQVTQTPDVGTARIPPRDRRGH